MVRSASRTAWRLRAGGGGHAGGTGAVLMDEDCQSHQADSDELRGGQAGEPSAVVGAEKFEEETPYGIEPEECDEDLTVVAFSTVHVKQANGGDRKGYRRFVDLGRMHRVRPVVDSVELLQLELRFARGAVRRKGQREGAFGPHTEAASGEQASHATETETQRDGEACHVRGFPERESIAPEQVNGHDRGADESAVIRQTAGPELRPRKAVGL